MMKSICILGATGSIGRSTMDVVRENPGRFCVKLLVAGKNARDIADAAREFNVPAIALADTAQARQAEKMLSGTGCRVFAGPRETLEAIGACGAKLCVSAIVGAAGLAPTMAAVDAGMDLALANKEALVAAGSILTGLVRKKGVRLLPVDSEHSALFQCLHAAVPKQVRRLVITASGGPFRGSSHEDLQNITPAQAMAHPTWRMGAKVTIDSATLANKALEVIEAHWLFNIPYDRISVIVHPQSVVHGLVEFIDGSTLAQLALPDMRLPIQFALTFPERLENHRRAPDLCSLGKLEFEAPDHKAFPMLSMGIEAAKRGGLAPAMFSAANEEAVRLFVAGRIGFMDIPAVVEEVLAAVPGTEACKLEDIFLAQQDARELVKRRFA